MAKLHYTEHIQFQPERAWVVLGPERRVLSLHVSKREAEKHAIALQVETPHLDVTFTRCVVLPNFSIDK